MSGSRRAIAQRASRSAGASWGQVWELKVDATDLKLMQLMGKEDATGKGIGVTLMVDWRWILETREGRREKRY
jgi:hypothetical protein